MSLKSKWSVKNWSNSLQNLETQAWILLWISQKSPFCYFSCNKKGLWGRMVTKVSALECSDLGASLTYLKHVYQTIRKFFRNLWSRKSHSKIAKIRLKILKLKLEFYLIFPKIALLWRFLHWKRIVRSYGHGNQCVGMLWPCNIPCIP